MSIFATLPSFDIDTLSHSSGKIVFFKGAWSNQKGLDGLSSYRGARNQSFLNSKDYPVPY